MRRLLAPLLALGLVAGVIAAPAAAAQRPLVYVVVIDGLDGDTVEAGKAPFVSSLLAGEGAHSTYFPASRSVMPAETNPNHTAMMSGAFPGASGIPANGFALYAPLETEDSCSPAGPFDFNAIPTETSGESAGCPRAEFVFEAIRRSAKRRSIATAAIFGKPKLGRIFAGRNANPNRRDVDYLWAPCASGPDDDYCGDVPVNPVSGYALDDDTVMDRVIASIEDGIPFRGASKRPDLTFVNLHQVDSAGHASGRGLLYDAAVGLADDEIEDLVTKLRERDEWRRTVLVLLSDHSMESTPQHLNMTGEFSAAGISDDRFLVVGRESAELVYVNRRDPGRFGLLRQLRATALATPGVAEALYRAPNPADGGRRHTVGAVHPDWHSAGRRSGDLLITGDPGTAFSEPESFSNPLPGNHGNAATRDNFLSVISGGPLVRQRTVQGPSRASKPQNVDVAATVMGLFGLFRTADDHGRFLAPAFFRGRLPRPARPRLRIARRAAGAVTVSWPAPGGGRWDVQRSAPGGWVVARTDSRTAGLVLRGAPGARRCARVRARSAAGVTGAWARRCVFLGRSPA